MAFGDSFGISFQPGAEGADPQQGGLQEAVKLLNLRLPSVVGAASPVPQGILFGGPQGSGGLQGQPETAALMQQWRRILGLDPMSGMLGPMEQPQMAGGTGSPAPPMVGAPQPSNPNRGGGAGGSAGGGGRAGGGFGDTWSSPSPNFSVEERGQKRGDNA